MKTFIFMLTITAIAASFAYAADPSDDSLILYFSFDELDGDTVTDHSQYGNDGTLAGAPELAAGKFGNALQLNGESDWVEVPHADILTVDTNVTVMAWINAGRHKGPNEQRWQGNRLQKATIRVPIVSTLNFRVSACISVLVAAVAFATGKVELNEWQHVASTSR